MFEHLSPFRVVVVTGPQRSGTRIAAKMIAQDTGKHYVDELAFHAHSERQFEEILSTPDIVVQAPGMCHLAHLYGKRDDLAVVFMRRDVDDIIASEKRINWDHDWKEYEKYKAWRGVANRTVPVSKIKYYALEYIQKQDIKHLFEVQYESLREHPLWKPKEERKNFAWNQTQ